MRKASIFSGLFLVLFLLVLPGAVSAHTKAVVGLPVLGTGDLADDLYLYSCSDSTCSTITQLEAYGHITNVPRWPKGAGGPGGPVPQIWVFLPLTDGAEQYFQFWQKSGDCWQSCILALNSDGSLNTAATTCQGTVYTAPTSTPPSGATGVPSFTMGAAMFHGATCQTEPPSKNNTAGTGPRDTNTLPDRTLTFRNESTAQTICLQTDSTFEHTDCVGAEQVTASQPYVIESATLQNGYNSGVAQVMAYQNEGPEWTYTGRGLSQSAQVYATNLEWTVWPQHNKHTMGPSTVDISLVNGFNVGATLTVNTDTVVYIADTEGGVPYFVLYPANSTIASFPTISGTLESLCPPANQAPISGPDKLGCYSPCSYARYYQTGNVDAMCCEGDNNTPATCTAPPGQPYVQNVNGSSTRVYSWAFNDWRGTFTCEPTASFTFKIYDVQPLVPLR